MPSFEPRELFFIVCSSYSFWRLCFRVCLNEPQDSACCFPSCCSSCAFVRACLVCILPFTSRSVARRRDIRGINTLVGAFPLLPWFVSLHGRCVALCNQDIGQGCIARKWQVTERLPFRRPNNHLECNLPTVSCTCVICEKGGCICVCALGRMFGVWLSADRDE